MKLRNGLILAVGWLVFAASAQAQEVDLKTIFSSPGTKLLLTQGDDAACTMQYDPVCGVDGQTYSNECVAIVTGVEVASAGICIEEGEGRLPRSI